MLMEENPPLYPYLMAALMVPQVTQRRRSLKRQPVILSTIGRVAKRRRRRVAAARHISLITPHQNGQDPHHSLLISRYPH